MNTQLLSQRIEGLKRRTGADVEALEAILRWLLASSEAERFRINPRTMARTLGLPLENIVEELLHGVQGNVFDLHWDIHCPVCYVISEEHGHLGQTRSSSYCQVCQREFDVELLGFVEVTFSLTKEFEELDYPIAGTPPVVFQPRFRMHVPAHSQGSAEETLAPGGYFFISTRSLKEGELLVGGAPSDAPEVLRITEDEGALEPLRLEARPGPVRIEFDNRSRRSTDFWLAGVAVQALSPENLPERLSGLELLHVPAFHRLFKGQVLSFRERIRIASVTVLFTDITGSTQMYERLGDAVAYNVVRDHFDILFEAVIRSGGTVVKTIGDAVMASFIHNGAALRGVVHALGEFERYNRERRVPERICLKMGLHRGPAILVTLNERLDYFGLTINKAARIQAQARSGELVVSNEVFADPSFQEVLSQAALEQVERYVGNLKGLEGDHVLYKIAVGAAPR